MWPGAWRERKGSVRYRSREGSWESSHTGAYALPVHRKCSLHFADYQLKLQWRLHDATHLFPPILLSLTDQIPFLRILKLCDSTTLLLCFIVFFFEKKNPVTRFLLNHHKPIYTSIYILLITSLILLPIYFSFFLSFFAFFPYDRSNTPPPSLVFFCFAH